VDRREIMEILDRLAHPDPQESLVHLELQDLLVNQVHLARLVLLDIKVTKVREV